jgi:hypothetical protein
MHAIVDRHAPFDACGGVDRLSRDRWKLYSCDLAEALDDGRQPIDEGRVVVDKRRAGDAGFERQTLELSQSKDAAEPVRP